MVCEEARGPSPPRGARVFCSSESWDSAICRPASLCRFSVRGHSTSNLTPSHLRLAALLRVGCRWAGRHHVALSHDLARRHTAVGGGRNPSCSRYFYL